MQSVSFEAWILQIMLSEILDVPTTIELGTREGRLNFYDPDAPFDYGVPVDFDSLRRAAEAPDGDCSLVVRSRDGDGDGGGEYRSCSHVIPEVWSSLVTAREMFHEGLIEAPQGLGAIGHQAWTVPRVTLERDPTLGTYHGLAGELNRRKLADRFLRPTTWRDYCAEVSATNCIVPDGVARRPPHSAANGTDDEELAMFSEGAYTGHFRRTAKNDCDKNPETCTGHIVRELLLAMSATAQISRPKTPILIKDALLVFSPLFSPSLRCTLNGRSTTRTDGRASSSSRHTTSTSPSRATARSPDRTGTHTRRWSGSGGPRTPPARTS